MANTTVYPYGTNGLLPDSIGIINDLVTGGADKALSALLGVVLDLKTQRIPEEIVNIIEDGLPINYINTVNNNILKYFGWTLDASLNLNSVNTNYQTGFGITPYIPINDISGHSITFSYRFGGNSTRTISFYDSLKNYLGYYSCSNSNTRTITIDNSLSNARFLRMTANTTDLPNVYILDSTTDKYIYNYQDFATYISGMHNELLDFGSIYNILNHYKTDVNDVTYFKKGFIACYFSEHPLLNPFVGDCVGTIIERRYHGLTESESVSRLYAASADNNNSFEIGCNGTYINVKYKKNGGSLVTKNLTGTGNYIHNIICVNIRTGETKVWCNGSLVSSESIDPSGFPDFSTMNRVILGCNTIYGKRGSAIINHMLTDEIAKLIYNNYPHDEFIPLPLQANSFEYSYKTSGFWYLYITGTLVDGVLTITNPSGTTSNSNAYILGDWITDDDRIRYTHYTCNIKVISGKVKIIGFDISGRLNTTVYNSNGESLGLSKNIFLEPGEYTLSYLGKSSGNGNYVMNLQYSEEFSFELTNLKKKQVGCPIYVSKENYNREGFILPSGELIVKHNTIETYTDTYKPHIVDSSYTYVLYNGQLKYNDGKFYMGYLIGSGNGTWKQISNA